MTPKPNFTPADLFRAHFDQILNPDHPLLVLASRIDWTRFDKEIAPCYDSQTGRPGINTRIMVALFYLKATYNLSDEQLLEQWVENPYWQAFCGFHYFQHEMPIDPSSLSRWRHRIKPERIELLLKIILETGIEMKAISKSDLMQVTVDTTVQEKAIAFPTDSRLYQKARLILVRRAKQIGIKLKETYQKAGKAALIRQSKYSHAKQFKRASREEKSLKTMLGRIVRILERNAPKENGQIKDDKLRNMLQNANRLLQQTKTSKNKLYSMHAPEVNCISKGKAHKRYEFGCKVGLVSSVRSNWVLGIQAFEGSPFDGHTLAVCISQMERLTGANPDDVVVDQGYKGHDYQGSATVRIVKKLSRSLPPGIRRLLKRRSAVEPIIGHLKSDHRMDRNYLRGVAGDKINALMAGIGFNLRKLLRWVIFAMNGLIAALMMVQLRQNCRNGHDFMTI
ncbi:MAG: IS5 family transposase [bacterium]